MDSRPTSDGKLGRDQANDLLRKTAGGAGWTIAWRVATRALGFLSTLALARILVPADFGLVALAMSFALGIDTFGEIGVKEALIRASGSDRDTYNAAFTINLIRGLVTTIVIAASAGIFANLIGDRRLTPVVLVLAPTVMLDALENVGVADFRRNLDFGREFRMLIFPRLAQFVITIVLALAWRDYWALVAGIITSRLLQTSASYIMHPYRPRISVVGWRYIASFAVWTWLLSMARMIRERGTTMIIGASLGSAVVGVFEIGSEVASLPDSELLGPLGRACFASFAAARRIGLSVSETYLRIVSMALVVGMPAAVGLSAVAAPLVHVAFGEKWLEAVPVVQILAATGLFVALRRISFTLFNAFAYLRWMFSVAVCSAVLQFSLLFPLLAHAGVLGAALAVASVWLAEQIAISGLVFWFFRVSPWGLLSRLWRGLIATLGMAAFLALSGLGWTPNSALVSTDIWRLLAALISGASLYAAILLGLWRISRRPNGPEADLLSAIKSGALSIYDFANRPGAKAHGSSADGKIISAVMSGDAGGTVREDASAGRVASGGPIAEQRGIP